MGNELGCNGCGNLFNENENKNNYKKEKVTFGNQKGLKIGKTSKNQDSEKIDELLFESKFKEEDKKMKEYENFYDYEPGLRISLAPNDNNVFDQSCVKKSMFIDEIINVENQKLENKNIYTGSMMRIPDRESTTSDKVSYINNRIYLINGKGKINNTDGSIFEGYFENGYANGLGKLSYINGDYYEGDWLNDFPEGKGEQKKGFMKYIGNFVKGLKEGDGEILLPDKSKYIGEFKNDCYHGFGKMFWENGMKYSGFWENNKMNGKGEFVWPDKNMYKGYYLEGKKHGKGEFTYASGLVYKGTWLYGEQYGEGQLFKNDKIILKGTWIEGKFKENN